MRQEIRMELFPVTELTPNSKQKMSVCADLTFTEVSVNQGIRALVVDTINGLAGRGGIKSRLRATAIALGLTFDRVRRYHYNEVKRIPAHEAFQIIQRAQLAKRAEFARKRLEYESLRLEIAEAAPSWLQFLVPPAVAPLPDLEGAAEVDER
jgi:hypothetical protein